MSEQSTEKAQVEMRRSWLVQRLRNPRGGSGPLANAFAFGGGLCNGGLTAEAMALLRDVFAFDYMGSAEFEFGEVPRALARLAAAADSLAAGGLLVELSQVAPPFPSRDKVAPTGTSTVYWLAPQGWASEVEARIRGWAREGYRAHLKESTNLDRALRPEDDYDSLTCGWLELDNGFMFFTDQEMWARSCALFGVAIPPGQATP